jgi:beta-glucuronidase
VKRRTIKYQKPAWYQRIFYIPEKGNLHIRFESVFYLAKVWFDGQLLGEHEGGYSPFTFDIPDVSKGDHELIVCVYNSLDDETLPKNGVDWFPYGGIYRPVYAELISDTYIDNFHLILSESSESEATFIVKAFIKSIKTGLSTKDVSLYINGKRYYSQKHDISGRNTTIDFEITIEKPMLWSGWFWIKLKMICIHDLV